MEEKKRNYNALKHKSNFQKLLIQKFIEAHETKDDELYEKTKIQAQQLEKNTQRRF